MIEELKSKYVISTEYNIYREKVPFPKYPDKYLREKVWTIWCLDNWLNQFLFELKLSLKHFTIFGWQIFLDEEIRNCSNFINVNFSIKRIIGFCVNADSEKFPATFQSCWWDCQGFISL